MSPNEKNRYNRDFDETNIRSSAPIKRSTKETKGHVKPSINTDDLSKNLEKEVDLHVTKTRRETTYSTGPLPTDELNSSSRRSERSGSGSSSSARKSTTKKRRPSTASTGPRSADAEERYRERRRLRKEAARWRRAHWIVRMLIVLVLILDIIVLRFGVFKGGFSPVWNILTAKGSSSETTAEETGGTGLQINEQLLTVNEYSRPGTALDAVNGIVVHYIGNPGTDAQENRDYFENLKDGATGVYASCNYIIGLDGTIIQCIPDNEVAYASGERNSDTISIECCHPDESGAFTQETFSSLVLLTAKLCNEYGLSTDQILRHYDVNQKPCPKYFVEDPDAWSNYLQAVKDNM